MLNLEKSIVWTTTNSRSFLPNCIIVPMEQNYEKDISNPIFKKVTQKLERNQKEFFNSLFKNCPNKI